VTSAEAVARRLNEDLSRWANEIEHLAQSETLESEPADPTAARRLLEDLRRRSPTFSWIGLVGADGYVTAGTGGLLEGTDVSIRPWFGPGLAGLYLRDVHPSVPLARRLTKSQGGGEGASFVSAAAPVRTRDGRTTGLVVGHLTWRWADDIRTEVTSLVPRHLPMRLWILGPDGSVRLNADGGYGRPWSRLSELRAGVYREILGSNARTVIAAEALVDDLDRLHLGWIVLAEIDREAVVGRLDRLFLLSLVGIGLMSLFGLSAAWSRESRC